MFYLLERGGLRRIDLGQNKRVRFVRIENVEQVSLLSLTFVVSQLMIIIIIVYPAQKTLLEQIGVTEQAFELVLSALDSTARIGVVNLIDKASHFYKTVYH